MNTLIKTLSKALSGALLALAATAANAQSVTYDWNYIAQANSSSTLSPGASIASLGGQNVGSINFTDLSDLNLGDGKTGVRITASLNNLSQFGNYSSNTLEFNFLGTGTVFGASNKAEWITVAGSYRNISNNFAITADTSGGVSEGAIEWAEGGSVGNGTANNTTTSPSHKWAFFQQQFNVTLGTWGDNKTIQFDFLNGDTLTGGPNSGQPYNGFTVANLASVANQGGNQPDTFAWLRLQPSAGSSGAPTSNTTAWYYPYMTTTGSSAGRINILAVAAVPEADTSAMLATGLLMFGFMARRRNV